MTVDDVTAGYAGAIAFNTDGNASVTATGDINVLNGVQNGGIAAIAALANQVMRLRPLLMAAKYLLTVHLQVLRPFPLMEMRPSIFAVRLTRH